jgi:hypothetical protein
MLLQLNKKENVYAWGKNNYAGRIIGFLADSEIYNVHTPLSSINILVINSKAIYKMELRGTSATFSFYNDLLISAVAFDG